MTPKRVKYPIARVLATGAFASLAVLAACEAKLPTADEVAQMTASTATAAMGRMAMIDTANVAYYIDGRVATKEQAEKLEAEQIATVNVSQKGAQSGGEVRIITRTTAVGDSSPARMTFVTPGSSVTLTTDMRETDRRSRTDPQPVNGLNTGLRLVDGLRSEPTPPTPPSAPTRTGFTGLMIVDGVITDPAVANTIAPDQIVSVDVIKGASAASQYSDPRAANGVIKINTKKAAKR